MLNAQPIAMQAEKDAIWRKITWRIMPIVLIAYVMAFLDRINVGYAKLTMQQDLQFSDEVYGLGAGIFFITYMMFEVPSNMWMERIGARRTLLRIMVLWGIASTATAWVTTPLQFYIVRLLLGAFEAGFFPGIILYLTYWFPSSRRGRVTGWFMFGMPIAGVLGGPLSGWIMKTFDGTAGWHGWQWLFVIEGIPTIFIGVLVYLLLTDKPEQARWLNDREKAIVKQQMDADQHGQSTHANHGGLAGLKIALGDRMTWIFAFIYFTCACAVYTLTFWLPTIVKSMGISDVAQIGWYTAIPFIFGAIGILVLGRSSDHFRERRWHVASTLIIGSTALYATTFTAGSFVLSMVLLCIAAFFIFGCALFWTIPPTYLSRQAAATGIAVISSLGIFGGFVSPTLIGAVKSYTGSMSAGLLAMMVLICVGGITLLLAVPKTAVQVGKS